MGLPQVIGSEGRDTVVCGAALSTSQGGSVMRTAMIETAIRMELYRNGPCALRALIERLPQFSWNEVFAVVDRISREGTLVLRRRAQFDYEVSDRPILEPSRERRTAVGEGVPR